VPRRSWPLPHRCTGRTFRRWSRLPRATARLAISCPEVPGPDRMRSPCGRARRRGTPTSTVGAGPLARARRRSRRGRGCCRGGARGGFPGPPHDALLAQARLKERRLRSPGAGWAPARRRGFGRVIASLSAGAYNPPANEGQGTPRRLFRPLRGPAPLAPSHHRQPPGARLGRAGPRPYLFAVWAAMVVVLIAAAARHRALEDDE